MASAKGSALEWALALLRAPGERHDLRNRPLPGEMQLLIGIAAGAVPEELEKTAARFGENEAVVREAAQFYAREVLFFHGANAYRTLGVEPDADQEQIKQHHRLLQHWLHPDRMQSEDDAVFAGRVNIAWNVLRSEHRRAAYDQELSQEGARGHAELAVSGRQLHAWAQPPLPSPRGQRIQRLSVFAILLSCVGLAIIAVRDGDRQPEHWRERLSQAAAGPDEPLAIRVPGWVAAPNPESRRPLSAKPEGARQVQQRGGLMNPPGGASTPLAGRATPAVAVVSNAPAAQVASEHGTLPMRTEREPGQEHNLADVVQAPTPVLAASAANAGSIHRSVRPSPPSTQPPASAATNPTVAARAEVPPAVNVVLPSTQRILQAELAGKLLLRYLVDASRPSPPLWNNASVQADAIQLRRELLVQGKVRLGDPVWRIASESAAFTSSYSTGGGHSQTGTVGAEWVWRDGQWLVTDISTEQRQ